MISLNNIFMLSLTFSILVGTIYPLFASVLFNSKISVGAPFFNSILMPVMFLFILGMIIGPYTKWGKDDLIFLLNRIKILSKIIDELKPTLINKDVLICLETDLDPKSFKKFPAALLDKSITMTKFS